MFNTITYLLFTHLAIGGAWAISLVPDQASKGFFRFCGSACAALLAIALFVAPPQGPVLVHLGLTLGLLLIFVILIVNDQPALARKVVYAAGLAGAIGLSSRGYSMLPEGWPYWVAYASAVYEIISAAFLGSVIFAMTLGHWYLVVPTLPIGPLRTLTLLMIAAALLKTLLIALVLYLGAYSPVHEIAEIIEGFSRLGGLFFWARALFGVLGPLILCYMTWETVKLNATQSATGLLYVATILVLIGETMSRFLYHTTHLPV